ncbi:MAG: type I 3-dehydroquinate dehydratase [Planctomycetaceae bacterium]
MICISVTPESRTLAPADLLNASRQCDLIELCLDHFLKEPNVAELIRSIEKPVLVSCRRPKDGGHWQGTEEQRITLLRSAIVAEPAYIELDLDIAPGIPRFGNTKRVIAYTSLNRPLSRIDDVFEKCYQAKADIVKVTWPTENLDAAWPLLAAVTQKRELPVVGQGMGHSGITFSLLGKRFQSPWIYAALEKGMEAFEHQPSINELKEDFSWDDIDSRTQFFGIVSGGRCDAVTARTLNAAFRSMDRNIRCLPIIPGDLKRLPRMLATLKINALICDPLNPGGLNEMTTESGEANSSSGYADLLMQKGDRWTATSTIMDSIDRVGQQAGGSPDWTGRGSVLICGHGSLAKHLAAEFLRRGAAVSLASPSDNAASAAAKSVGARQASWASVYDLRIDTIAVAAEEVQCGSGRGQLNPGIIRERMTMVDLSGYPDDSRFAEESRARGARLISGSDVFQMQMRLQFRKLTGRDLPV